MSLLLCGNHENDSATVSWSRSELDGWGSAQGVYEMVRDMEIRIP